MSDVSRVSNVGKLIVVSKASNVSKVCRARDVSGVGEVK